MSQSPFARSLFISACVSGLVFSVAAAPFAMFKSNTIGVELQNKNIYTSELKYLAGPYLALAGGISAAFGLGVFGLTGWRQSARRVADAETARQEMARNLAVHQAELERIKFSETRLHSQNLSAFLHPNLATAPVTQATAVALEAAVHPAVEPRLAYSQPSRTVAPVPAQGVAPDKSVTGVQPIVLDNHKSEVGDPSPEPLESLLHQLHQLSKQVEELRGHSGNHLAA